MGISRARQMAGGAGGISRWESREQDSQEGGRENLEMGIARARQMVEEQGESRDGNRESKTDGGRDKAQYQHNISTIGAAIM